MSSNHVQKPLLQSFGLLAIPWQQQSQPPDASVPHASISGMDTYATATSLNPTTVCSLSCCQRIHKHAATVMRLLSIVLTVIATGQT